jgi:hypothetical protein
MRFIRTSNSWTDWEPITKSDPNWIYGLTYKQMCKLTLLEWDSNHQSQRKKNPGVRAKENRNQSTVVRLMTTI